MGLRRATLAALCVCSLAAWGAAGPARAQDPESSSWLTLGSGLGTGGTGVSGGFTLKRGAQVASIRVAGTGRTLGGDLWDVGLLYGRAASGDGYLVSLAGGVGMAGGHRRPDPTAPRERIRSGFGVPLELQGFVRPFRWGGLGLYAYAEISSRATFAGASLAMQLGAVR